MQNYAAEKPCRLFPVTTLVLAFASIGLIAQASIALPAGAESADATTQAASPEKAAVIPEWNKILRTAFQANISGEADNASSRYLAAIASAEKAQDNKGIMSCLSAYADFLETQGNLNDQEPLRKRALSIAETKFGKSSPQYAQQLAKMAGWLAKKGDSGQARSLVEQATAILGSPESKYPVEMASCYIATAKRQIAEGTLGLADDSYKQALALQESALAPTQPAVLKTCKEYAALLDQLGRKDDADKLRDRINLAKATGFGAATTAGAKSQAGVKSDSLFAKLVEDAKAADAAGNKAAAMSNWRLAVQEAEKKTTTENQLAFALLHLADEYRGNKQDDEAVSLYKRALSLREKNGKDNTLGMARNLKRLGQCYMQSKPAEAESLLKRAIEIEQKCQASDCVQASTLQSLLSACMVAKDNQQAEQTAKQLLAISAKQSGAVAAINKRMAMGSLGSIYIQSGRVDEGMKLMKELSSSMSTESAADASKTYTSEYVEGEKQVDQSELQ